MTQRLFGATGWTADRLPDLSRKTYIITGGNSGIGFEAARMLGERGGDVTILCRNSSKAEQAVAKLQSLAPGGKFSSIQIDLSSLESIRAAAADVRKESDKIDALINNAGIMMVPKRELTADNFETQFGVNHLGHFAFNALLCDIVEASEGRFVSVASAAHKFAPSFKFEDIMFESGYTPTRAYAQSKLANLSYALELNRRLVGAGRRSRAFACHPGYAATNLQSTGPGAVATMIMQPMNVLLAQSAKKGALPTVLCAADEDAAPGGYYGPTGFMNMKGPVGPARYSRTAKDKGAAEKLWTLSEELTGERWSILK